MVYFCVLPLEFGEVLKVQVVELEILKSEGLKLGRGANVQPERDWLVT